MEVINCYYDEDKGVRTSIYLLKEPLKNENFVTVDSFTLAGNELLNLVEKPNTELLLAHPWSTAALQHENVFIAPITA